MTGSEHDGLPAAVGRGGPRARVDFVEREDYLVRAHDHRAPTGAGLSPVELFVTSMAVYSAYYAGRFLTRHGLARDGLRVVAEHLVTDGSESLRLDVRVPGGAPESLLRGLQLVAAQLSARTALPNASGIDIRAT